MFCLFLSNHLEKEIIATNGNRYDVNLVERTRTSAYWIEPTSHIRRSKWFYSTPKQPRFAPFDETTDEILEVINSFIKTFGF